MRRMAECVSWVVYRMTINKKPSVNAVCEQGEWDAMQLAQPGHHLLVREGIGSEMEAERLARVAPADGRSVLPPALKLPNRT